MAIERVAQAEAGALSRLFPSVGVGAKASRYDGGDIDLVLLKPFGIDRLEFDRWQAGLQASWELDLFGQRRARLAAAREQSKAAQADVQAVTLSVDASVANIYVNYRGLQKQQQLMLENLAIVDEVVRIAERSFDVGVVKSTDVDLARADVAQLQARFEASLRQSDLARLNYLPRLNLRAVLGRSGIHTNGQSLGGSGFWMADLLFALLLIDFGARKSEVQFSDAQSRQAFLVFEQSARGALFDVERTLATLDRIDRQTAAR